MPEFVAFKSWLALNSLSSFSLQGIAVMFLIPGSVVYASTLLWLWVAGTPSEVLFSILVCLHGSGTLYLS